MGKKIILELIMSIIETVKNSAGVLNTADKADDVSLVEDSKAAEIAADRLRWANRRKMAKACLIVALIISVILLLAILVSDSMSRRIAENKDILFWVLFFAYSIAGGYMGITTYSDIKGVSSPAGAVVNRLMGGPTGGPTPSK
jgi:hypothetical protein